MGTQGNPRFHLPQTMKHVSPIRPLKQLDWGPAKGYHQEPEELFAATGTVEVVKNLEGGVVVIQA